MSKKFGSILIIMIFLFASIGIVMAEAVKGNARKGKYLFRKNCRTCHCEDGSAKPMSPIDKTQAQWDEVFKNIDKLSCSKEWAKLSEKDRTICTPISGGMRLIRRPRRNASSVNARTGYVLRNAGISWRTRTRIPCIVSA